MPLYENKRTTTQRKRKMESQIDSFFVAPKPLDMWLNKGENEI